MLAWSMDDKSLAAGSGVGAMAVFRGVSQVVLIPSTLTQSRLEAGVVPKVAIWQCGNLTVKTADARLKP